MKRALLIMGPTASGKSALALHLAEKLSGEIINADSMQVYRDLHVLTARPSSEEEAQASHHLYGAVDAAVRYSVGRWLDQVHALIADIRARGKTPIVAGGTGLYLKALTEGLAPAPEGSPETRARLMAELAEEGPAQLHARLSRLDLEAALRINLRDSVRILRALEVAETGARLSSLHDAETPVLSNWRGVTIWPDRAALYAKIEKRFDAMINAGALAEVKALMARGLDPLLPAMKAHGAPWLMAHLRGDMALETAVSLAKRDTRRYAKRQFTWMANQMPHWRRIEAAEENARIDAALGALEAPAIDEGQRAP